MNDTPIETEEAPVKVLDLEHLERLAARSRPTQSAVKLIGELLGNTRGKTCLLANGGQAGLALGVLKMGGEWSSLHANRDLAETFRAEKRERTWHLSGSTLPFDDDWFDVIVINDILEHVPDPERLLHDCHRVLKQNGVLLLHTPRTKKWAMAQRLRRWMGLDDDGHGPQPRSFTETELFDLAKDGFDFEESRTYNRFFSEFTEGVIQFVSRYRVSQAEAGAAPEDRLVQVRGAMYPLAVVAGVLDVLVGFTAGYYMVVRARRRVWRPRRTPKLTDGRSIADAALNTKIGTAQPF